MDALFSNLVTRRLNAKTFIAFTFVMAISICFSCAIKLEAAGYQTANFVFRNVPNDDLARQFGETAEQLRKELAILWLGHELPRWSSPCPVFVKVGNFSAGGETSMQFDKGEVFDWDMQIQGSAESILTAVLPHEITHMILASHFRQPSPRWFDEGAATLVENEKERQNYRRLLYQYLQTGRGIPFNLMFSLGEYPDDQMPLYAQGFSLAEFLIMQRGHRHYVDFAAMGMKTNNWPQAICDYYGYENLGELQVKWNRWVKVGYPDLRLLSQDEPIFVSQTTQYIVPRDIMPVRQPVILARAEQPAKSFDIAQTNQSSDVISAAWVAAQPVQNLASDMQPEREPIRMSLAQTQKNQNHNQPIAAKIAPIPESGNSFRVSGHDVPQAIPAQPVVAPSAITTAIIASPDLLQQNSISEARLPSYFTENQPAASQQLHQSSRSMLPPQNDHNSQVIFDWRIR